MLTDVVVIDILREAVQIILKTTAPVLGVAMGVGILIALFQAMTQIQEMTLTFVPKIVAILFTLILSISFIMNTLISFAQRIFDKIMHLS